MTKTIDTLDEATARSEWHKACSEFGISNCKVERIEPENASPIFRITITSQVVKTASRKVLYVGFAEVKNGTVTYRDGIRADSVTEAIAVRFGGKLPEGFIVEKVVR